MKKWSQLPEDFQNEEVKRYYDILQKHNADLIIKRIFDIIIASILLVALSPVLLLISILIKIDSKGPVMFCQTRVTMYGDRFRIYKFRTMIDEAEKLGTQVTTKGDIRITKMGKILRGYRLDELPQLFNILKGDMTFVGTRPEVEKYVAHYTNEMKATLLMRAGVTSRTSIEYKDEDRLLEEADNADEVYVNQVLPAKMKYNLEAIEKFSLIEDIKTMFATVLAVIK